MAYATKNQAKSMPNMTQQDKDLLLKDLCARLPYGVKIQRDNVYDHNSKKVETLNAQHILDNCTYNSIEALEIRPYLRPMSSMTEEEEKEYKQLCFNVFYQEKVEKHLSILVDFLNAHHVDYRNLIGKGLALEAPDGMYNTK